MNALFPSDDVPAGRLPPANVEIEIALLGAILVDNRAWEKVSEFLRPEHFADEVHGRIYEAASTIIGRGGQATAATLRRAFENDEALTAVGGARYLAELAIAAFNIIDAEDYARTIRDLYLRRELIALGHDVVSAAYGAAVDVGAAEIGQAHVAAVDGLFATLREAAGFAAPRVGIAETLSRIEAARQSQGGIVGLATGLRAVDRILGGLKPGKVYLLGGRPSMGKSSLAEVIAHHVARRGTPVGYFSLEVTEEDIRAKAIARRTGLDVDRLVRGMISPLQFQGAFEAGHELGDVPLLIDATSALTIDEIRARARRQHRRHGFGLIVIDHLHEVAHRNPRASQVERMTDIANGLRPIAKELGVPVLALSQLSRDVEKRDDKRPMLSDLRESGALEQVADVVAFVYRHEYYLLRQEPEAGTAEHAAWQSEMDRCAGVAELLIAKNRLGRTGRATLQFNASTTDFGDPAHEHEDQGVPF